MRQQGFTLVELAVVLALMAFLTTIGVLAFNEMKQEASIKSQATALYNELMAVRVEALHTKRARSVTLTSSALKVFPGNDTSATPVRQTTLTYPVVWKPASTTLTITFDTSGLCTPVGADIPICVAPEGTLEESTSAVDSLVVSTARIKLGKRIGGDCDASAISQK